MILKEKYSLGNDKQYYCKFTEELDRCAGLDIREYPYYRHYLLDYRDRDRFHNFPIRVPGGTVVFMIMNIVKLLKNGNVKNMFNASMKRRNIM